MYSVLRSPEISADNYILPQRLEIITNSRQADAAASQPPIHLSRVTGALLASPGWCRVSKPE